MHGYFYIHYALISESGYFLSFAWIVWDILSFVKKKYNELNQQFVQYDPLGMKLTEIIEEFLNTKNNLYGSIISKINTNIKVEFGTWKLVSDYVRKHEYFNQLLCYLACWHHQHKVEMDLTNFFVLIILVGSGTLNADVDAFEPFLCTVRLFILVL